MRKKVEKSRFTVFFQWFVAPEGRKVGSLKRRVRSQLARWEMKKCTPLWRERHVEVKMQKTHQLRTTFVKKVHAAVSRSIFRSQNVQNTPAPDHFWKLRCRKSAAARGAKHMWKSLCTKHTSSGPLLEVEMSKKVHAVVAWSTFRSQNAQNTSVSDHFWKFRCRKSAPHCGANHILTLGVRTIFGGSDVASLRFTRLHYITLHYTPLHYTTLPYTTLPTTTLHYITLHDTSLHYNYTTTLHYIRLRYTKLHYTTLHYTTLHYATLPSTTLHYTTLHYIILHYTTLHYLPLHFTTLHYTRLHYTTTTQLHNYTPPNSTTLHYTPLH